VRTVPIDAEVIRLLIDRHAAQKDDELRAGEAWEGQGHVFTDALGRPWHPDHLGDRFDKLCTQAKVRRIRLHDLRHTAASLMVARGVPLATAAALLGHASAATTADLYLHDLPGAGDAALAAMGAAFFANELQTNDEGR
jgi:integrase